MQSDQHSGSGRNYSRVGVLVFIGLALFHLWGATVGWESNNLPGGEFRQAQTAISSYYIQVENNFSLAYPTPVLGKPWSIPMEFPLYQWTVAGLCQVTGLELTQAGRAVSLLCFYLTLPAVFLLLGQLGVRRSHRLVALGLILTCPLYVFYGRAFLIETMALMFSLWFLQAFIEAVRKGSGWWLVLANLMGIGAGLVKVTTFMLYLFPAGVWALGMLYASRPTSASPGWRRMFNTTGLVALATALPFGATLWWIYYADATKALNPNAEFLLSSSLTGFNFGSPGTRFSGTTWQAFWQILRLNLVWPPVLAVCLGCLVIWGRAWWHQSLLCLVMYLGVVLLFPLLYSWHDYYSVASGMLLLTALSFGLLGLLASRLPRSIVAVVLATVCGGQIWLYVSHLYEAQRPLSPGGDGLTEAVGYLTQPDEVIVVVGDDWSSIIPYYARRRALMIRNGFEFNKPYVMRAFGSLQGERIGALILPQQRAGFGGLLELAERDLGIDPRPVLKWRNLFLYLPTAQRLQDLNNLRKTDFYEVTWMPGAEPVVARMAGEWYEFAQLRKEQRVNFEMMEPRPKRFFSTFGPGLGPRLGRTWYNAHPDTRLRFALSAGPHKLTTELMLDAGTYDPALNLADMTDGVNFDLNEILPDGQSQRRFTRTLDPRNHPEDRGPQVITFDFTLDHAAEVELFIGPGAKGWNARDWAWLGPVKFD